MADAPFGLEATAPARQERDELPVAEEETAPVDEDPRGVAERLREMKRFGAALDPR